VSYPHPKETERILLWDLPGFGVAEYPDTKTYFLKLKLGKNYDAFLFFNKGKFTIDNQRLAVRLVDARKPFLFVKTFIDVDVESDEMENCDEEKKTLEKIKKNILDGFNDLFPISKEQIFLISNVKIRNFEFPRLYENILDRELTNLPLVTCGSNVGWLNVKLAKLRINEKREIFQVNTGNSCYQLLQYSSLYFFPIYV
jgi:hypothetical protein